MQTWIFIAALMLQQAPPTELEAVTVEAAARPTDRSATIPDREIETQLNDLLAREPDRVICLYKTPTGTRIGKPICQTLRGWYDFESLRDTNSMRGGAGGIRIPPYELVELIKSRLRDPEARARAEARAGARLDAEALARANQN